MLSAGSGFSSGYNSYMEGLMDAPWSQVQEGEEGQAGGVVEVDGETVHDQMESGT